MNTSPLVIAIPKGRLQEQVFQYLTEYGITLPNPDRTLIIEDSTQQLRILLVKNSDLPKYVHAGVASLGIVGTDIIEENPYSFFNLGTFPFGSTKICLIGKQDTPDIDTVSHTNIATKYYKFTTQFLIRRNIQADIITLNGSVELAPLLGLAPYIIDLVDTGKTIQENGLTILEEITTTTVTLIANQSIYKLNYKEIDKVVRNLQL